MCAQIPPNCKNHFTRRCKCTYYYSVSFLYPTVNSVALPYSPILFRSKDHKEIRSLFINLLIHINSVLSSPTKVK